MSCILQTNCQRAPTKNCPLADRFCETCGLINYSSGSRKDVVNQRLDPHQSTINTHRLIIQFLEWLNCTLFDISEFFGKQVVVHFLLDQGPQQVLKAEHHQADVITVHTAAKHTSRGNRTEEAFLCVCACVRACVCVRVCVRVCVCVRVRV